MLISVLLGIIMRYFALTILDLDVIKDFSTTEALSFWFVYGLIRHIIVQFIDVILDGDALYMNSGISSPGSETTTNVDKGKVKNGTSANKTAHNMNNNNNNNGSFSSQQETIVPSIESAENDPIPTRNSYNTGTIDPSTGTSNQKNGPMAIPDPFLQALHYKIDGDNQPLLGNIRTALEQQHAFRRNTSMSMGMFTDEAEIFILEHLEHKHPAVFKQVTQYAGINGPEFYSRPR
jgi:hypothetical protein